MNEKHQLFEAGKIHISNWCRLNNEPAPRITVSDAPTMFDTCAYYRDNEITIWPDACATYGRFGRAWSWPGYVVDRTPYGVLAHELGHHIDRALDYRDGVFSTSWRVQTKEEPLTTYCDNDMEWFAEMFRLFVTNPDLLRNLRPLVAAKMDSVWKSCEQRLWKEVLPIERQQHAAQNKIDAVLRAARRAPKQEGLAFS